MQSSISNNAWFFEIPIFTVSKESNKILFISVKVLPGITAAKSFVSFCKYLLFHASLNPSTATTFNLLFFSFNTFCSSSIEFSTFISGNSGNSSGFIVANLYNDPSHSITNKFLSFTSILISESGSFLIISLNITALTTVAPCSSILHPFIMYSIPNSWS